MESKSPKRTREVSSLSSTGKRLRGEDGQPIPGSFLPSTVSQPPDLPPEPYIPLSDSTQAVRTAYDNVQDGKTRLNSVMSRGNEEFSMAGIRNALEEIGEMEGRNREVNGRYAEERERQRELENVETTLKERVSGMEKTLAEIENTAKMRVNEQKLRLESLEAEKSAALKITKREVGQLQSHLDLYKRLCGIELSALDSNSYRVKIRFQHNEIITDLTSISSSELEVEVKSYTVPAERIAQDLKEPIVIQMKDAPLLLHHLYQCLV